MELDFAPPPGEHAPAYMPPPTPLDHIAQRLERRFGLGAIPSKRRALFARLQLLVNVHGEKVEALISEAAACAAGKDKPGNYFCRAIVLKLREAEVYKWQE